MMRGTGPDAGGDRGSIALFVVIFAVGLLFLTSLLVDLGSVLSARERAADAAEQAARAAADTISPSALRSGTIRIDRAAACANAARLVSAYAAGNKLTMSELPGQAGCRPGAVPGMMTVTVQVTTKPLILPSLVGTWKSTMTESACDETQEEAC